MENKDDVGIVIEAKSGPFYQITGLFRQIGIFLNDLQVNISALWKGNTLQKSGIPGTVLFYDSSHALSSITVFCNINNPLPYLAPATPSLDIYSPDPNSA